MVRVVVKGEVTLFRKSGAMPLPLSARVMERLSFSWSIRMRMSRRVAFAVSEFCARSSMWSESSRIFLLPLLFQDALVSQYLARIPGISSGVRRP